MLNFGFRYLLCGGCQKFNRLTEEVCASLFANHITIYLRYELPACHCSACTHTHTHTHTYTAASTHTSFLFFLLHHVPSSLNLSTQQVHTHIFHESTVSERAACPQCTLLSGQDGGTSECAVGERDRRRSVSPHAPSLSAAGRRCQGMAARHGSLGCQEMAIIAGTPWLSAAPISIQQKLPLYVVRDSFPKWE